MFEIKAKLSRGESGIYAIGERVDCLIEFTQIPNDNDNANVSNLENLAWASVQLHCYRKTSQAVIKNDKTAELNELLGKTSLDGATQAPGDAIIATKPKILFCDLILQPKETKTYVFQEYLPRDGPPTYRGHDIKYLYKITIATQRVKSKIHSLTIPLRILPIPVIARPDEIPCTVETNEELAPTNPFVEKPEITELEISWHHIKNITARRAPKYYRISNKHGFVARFCLFKNDYKLGEDIVGSLDFSNCEVRCIQYVVKLQQQEIIVQHANNKQSEDDESSVASLDLASVASGTVADNLHKSSTSASAKDDEEPIGKISTQSTYHQVCYAMMQTYINVPIPLHITPSFHTDLVDVRWRLHFEFVTSTMMDFGKPMPEVGELQAPAEIPVETMVWNLPINIYATNPLQIHVPKQAHSLLIK